MSMVGRDGSLRANERDREGQGQKGIKGLRHRARERGRGRKALTSGPDLSRGNPPSLETQRGNHKRVGRVGERGVDCVRVKAGEEI